MLAVQLVIPIIGVPLRRNIFTNENDGFLAKWEAYIDEPEGGLELCISEESFSCNLKLILTFRQGKVLVQKRGHIKQTVEKVYIYLQPQ